MNFFTVNSGKQTEVNNFQYWEELKEINHYLPAVPPDPIWIAASFKILSIS